MIFIKLFNKKLKPIKYNYQKKCFQQSVKNATLK